MLYVYSTEFCVNLLFSRRGREKKTRRENIFKKYSFKRTKLKRRERIIYKYLKYFHHRKQAVTHPSFNRDKRHCTLTIKRKPSIPRRKSRRLEKCYSNKLIYIAVNLEVGKVLKVLYLRVSTRFSSFLLYISSAKPTRNPLVASTHHPPNDEGLEEYTHPLCKLCSPRIWLESVTENYEVHKGLVCARVNRFPAPL